MVAILRARVEDIPGIKAILAAAWHDTYSSFLSESSIAKVTAEWHSPKILESEVNDPSTFQGIAKSASAGIVGMITAHARHELLIIARLYVLPDFQRQGIGQKLMEESYRAFARTQRVRLDVEEQNSKARAFYQKLGFHEVDVRIDDIAGTTLTSIVLEKQIQNTP